MTELKMEHVLILLIVAFMLYHLSRCRCGNSFRVGGKDDPHLPVVVAGISGKVKILKNVNLAGSDFTHADLSKAKDITNIECKLSPVWTSPIRGMSKAKVAPIIKNGIEYPATFECHPDENNPNLGTWHKIPKCEPFGKDLNINYDETKCKSKYLKNFCTWEPSDGYSPAACFNKSPWVARQ